MEDVIATVGEGTTAQFLKLVRRSTSDADQGTILLIVAEERGHGAEQTHGVRVLRPFKQFVDLGALDDGTTIHDGDVEFAAEALDEFHDLGLDGDVEGGGGFVGDDEGAFGLRRSFDDAGDLDGLGFDDGFGFAGWSGLRGGRQTGRWRGWRGRCDRWWLRLDLQPAFYPSTITGK